MSRNSYQALGDGAPSAPLLSAGPGSVQMDFAGSRAAGASAFVLSADEAAIDEGFPSVGAPFERGRVVVRQGAAAMDLSALQQPLTTAQLVRSAAATVLALAVPVLGWAYLFSKFTLVRPGELALVRSISGETRALGQGCHIASTVGTEVKKASVTEPVVTSGTLTVLRVRNCNPSPL